MIFANNYKQLQFVDTALTGTPLLEVELAGEESELEITKSFHLIDATHPQAVIAVSDTKQPIQIIYRQPNTQMSGSMIDPIIDNLIITQQFFSVHQLKV